MNTQIDSPVKKILREIKPYTTASSTPYLALIRKTLVFELLTIKRIIISVFVMVFIPALVLFFAPPLSGEQHLIQLLGFVTWYYNFAIMFPIIIIGSTGPLISEELRSGTLLFLVSKPISRTKIILSKFIALFIFGITISFLSLSIICIMALIKYSFVDIGSYLGIFFIYGLVIILFFGGITMGFSSIFSRPRNVLLLPLALVIFSFLVMMMFKPLLLYAPDNWYEDLFLYNFDIGYHLSNIFLWLGESFDPEILNYFQMIFLMFGIIKMEISGSWEISYVRSNYYHPVVSLLFLIGIAGILIIIGVFSLKKRDISG
ncbi:MAG: ABC transporter permease [Promethearchaeota archaeon]|jgi:ABC-type transport system involved in multi-copper enzyme maturation permease subunit